MNTKSAERGLGSGVSPFPYLVGNRGRRKTRSLYNGGGLGWLWATIAIVVVAAIVIGSMTAVAYGKHHSVTTTVNSKERVCSGSNNGTDCKYLIFTEHGTYRITDAFLIGTTRFNSSDVYGRIHECDKYKIEYYGWRLPYFSSYPNIVKATDLGPVAGCRPS